MSAITAKASRKMKKYAVLTREPRCFLGSFDFSWEQRKFSDVVATRRGLTYKPSDIRKNGVRVLRSSNIAEDSFVLSDEDVFVVREAVNIDCVRANDILITAANGSSRLVGKHTIISGIPEESAVHGGFMLLGTTKEPHFVNASMGSSWYRRFIELFVAGGNGAIGNLNKNDLDNQDIAIPSEKEQKKIGSFFRQLDNLITLHQRKCVFLFGFFQAFISMIFTASTFSWEQRKLSEIADKVTAKNAGLQYVETFTNSAEFGIISQRDFFDHDIAKLGSLDGYYIVKNEDFVYNPRISTSAPVGPINRNKLGRTGVMSPLYTVFRPHDVDTTYLEHFFKCAYWHSFMNFNGDSGARSDRFSIKDDVFFQMPIPLPYIDEQRKIGELLTRLDHLITLHQRECISFTARAGRRILTANKKRNTSSWEQRKLGDIADIVGGGTPSTGNQSYWDGDIDWYAPAEIADQIYANSSQKKITGLGYENSSAKMLPPGTVLFTSRAGIGKTAILTRKGCTNQGFQSIVPHRGELDSYFIFSRTAELKRYGELVGAGSTFVEVSGKQMAVMELMMPPTMREQQTIGGFFQQLDHLITLHQRKPFLMKWRNSDANRNQTNRFVL